MPVTITSQKFYDEFLGTGGGGTDFLMGSVGDKITIETTFSVYWATENVDMNFDAAKTITRQDKTVYFPPIIYSPDKAASRPIASFITDGFKVGDTIAITGTPTNDGTYTIAAVTDTVITTVQALNTENAPNTYIYGDTVVTACDYYFNFLENNAPISFKSAVDNQNTNKYNSGALAIPMGSTMMTPMGSSIGWKDGTCKIDDVSLTAHHQIFKITHTVGITPAFIASWRTNIENSTAPGGFYQNGESLKFVCQIDCKFNNRSATPDHTTGQNVTFPKGNVGFYDEFLNGFPENYTLKSIAFTDVVTGLAVTGLQYGRTTDVDIRITSVNSVVAPTCKVVLNQIYCPLTESDYVNTKTLMVDNFRFDRKMLTEGAAAANGESFGTANQAITNAQAVRISASELQVKYRCDLAASYSTLMGTKDADNRNYLIFVTPQDVAVATTVTTDRNAVICDTANYTTDRSDSTLFQIIGDDIYFHEYPYEIANEFTDYKGWVGDMVLAQGQFQVKALSNVQLKTLAFKIEATKAAHDNIILEQFQFNIDSFVPDKDLIQQIDILEPTGFKCNDDSNYAYIELQRVSALDSGNYAAYDFRYPFKLRWESWVQLISKYYDNGTQDWATYEADGWAIKFNIYATCYDVTNVWTTDFLHTASLTVDEFDVNAPTAYKCVVSTWDEAETMDLEGEILTYENTVIKAQFSGDFSALPAGATGYYGVISLDSPEIGGEFYNQYSSTEEDVILDGIFAGYTGNRAEITKLNNFVVELKAVIDYTKIPDLSGGKYPLNYTMISAKFGYLNEPSYLLQEDFWLILQENNGAIALNP